MPVGFMGGTFDPIHVAHLIIAEHVLDRLDLSRVVFLPSARPPHKRDDEIAALSHRLEMVRLAIEDNPRFQVSDLEARRPDRSYTIDTIRRLRSEHADEGELHFIIGADSLAQFLTWKDPLDLLSECRFVVAPRPGVSFADADPRVLDRVILLDMPAFEISSSDVRERLRQGRSIRYLVPDEVRAYIGEKNLYS